MWLNSLFRPSENTEVSIRPSFQRGGSIGIWPWAASVSVTDYWNYLVNTNELFTNCRRPEELTIIVMRLLKCITAQQVQLLAVFNKLSTFPFWVFGGNTRFGGTLDSLKWVLEYFSIISFSQLQHLNRLIYFDQFHIEHDNFGSTYGGLRAQEIILKKIKFFGNISERFLPIWIGPQYYSFLYLAI